MYHDSYDKLIEYLKQSWIQLLSQTMIDFKLSFSSSIFIIPIEFLFFDMRPELI